MTDAELNEKMVAAGMFPLQEILAGNIMGKFSTHIAVNDASSLKWWVKSQHEKYLKMRMEYEVGGKEKDDMFEWVFAHSAVFGKMADHMNVAFPDLSPKESLDG